MADTPFDSIESAQAFVQLLALEVGAAREDIEEDVAEAVRSGAARRVDALHLAEYKLKQLAEQLDSSRRILNDLRTLRRLLVNDRAEIVAGPQGEDQGDPAGV